MSAKKKDKKCNSGHNRESKSAKGSTAPLNGTIQVRRPNETTVDVFRIAKLIVEKCGDVESPAEYVEAGSISLDMPSQVISWNRLIYETYVGLNPELPPRFELDYLLSLDPLVLECFVPHLRRSDYLNQHGLFTSTITTPDSIRIHYQHRTNEKGAVCDLSLCRAVRDGTILAPFGTASALPLMASSFTQLVFLDDLVTQFRASEFGVGGRLPEYADPRHRYYDHITACETTSGTLEIPILFGEEMVKGTQS